MVFFILLNDLQQETNLLLEPTRTNQLRLSLSINENAVNLMGLELTPDWQSTNFTMAYTVCSRTRGQHATLGISFTLLNGVSSYQLATIRPVWYDNKHMFVFQVFN